MYVQILIKYIHLFARVYCKYIFFKSSENDYIKIALRGLESVRGFKTKGVRSKFRIS